MVCGWAVGLEEIVCTFMYLVCLDSCAYQPTSNAYNESPALQLYIMPGELRLSGNNNRVGATLYYASLQQHGRIHNHITMSYVCCDVSDVVCMRECIPTIRTYCDRAQRWQRATFFVFSLVHVPVSLTGSYALIGRSSCKPAASPTASAFARSSVRSATMVRAEAVTRVPGPKI